MCGESGSGGWFGSWISVAPGCWGGGGGGDVAGPPLPPADAATEAGIGGDVVFLVIFDRAGAAEGTLGGGIAGELSW